MAIYWFTGQPSHGKTTLANILVSQLRWMDKKVFHIDGDDLRALTLNTDYSKQGRLDNITGAQKIAHYLHNKGIDVVVSLVSPYREQREEFKKIIGKHLVELYVHAEEPRERDKFKSLDYEPPLENFIDVNTTNKRPEINIKDILWLIENDTSLRQLLIG
jgi:adenylylsulfate kinase-like enzyme